MILNRRYRRNIKNNFSFYLCMTLLTIIAVFMDLLFSGAVDAEKRYLDSFQESAYCEDGQFTTYQALTDTDIETLEKEYNVVIEQQQYYNYSVEEDFRLRVFRPNEKLNGYNVAEGEDISSDNEILLSTGLVQARGIEIGDKVTINGEEFTVCGSFAKIDYLLMLESLSDSISNAKEFGIAIVSTSAFEKFDTADVSSYYSVAYNSDNETEFRKAINDKFMTASYLKASNNLRITTAPDVVSRYETFCFVILPMMLLCIVVLMAVIIGRKVKSEQRQIGVLLSLGYRRKELAKHYMWFGLIPGIIGSIVGIAISIPSIPYLGNMLFSEKVDPLPVDFNLDIVHLILNLLAPAVFYGFFAWFKAYRIMKKDPVDMMRKSSGDKHKNIFRMENSKKSINAKYMLRAVFGNISRSLIVIFGIALGGMLLAYAFICIDSMQAFVDKSIDQAGSYKYEYFLSSIQTEPVDDGVELLTSTFEVKDHSGSITLIGIDDAKYINDATQDGGKMELSGDGYYLTSKAALEFGVSKGDTITVLNVTSLEEHEVEVAGIVTNDSQNVLYTSRAEASEIVGVPAESYNAVMSEVELPYAGSEVYDVVTMDELKEQMQNFTEMTGSLVYMITVFGVFICVIAVYLMVNILLSENASVISMLKILGYRNKEINRMTTHIYHWLVPVGIVLGLLIGYYSCAMNFEASIASYHVYFTPVVYWQSIALYVALIVVSYVISLWLLGRKVKKADMVACLKDTNE